MGRIVQSIDKSMKNGINSNFLLFCIMERRERANTDEPAHAVDSKINENDNTDQVLPEHAANDTTNKDNILYMPI